ncbi:hypothetical protein [Vibrio sinaloensis]|uniref:Uncharacterized protein n=1 Tax=Photobacterium sp. (strain ATCC 43367) TaxID=379097 RepID=A0A0A5HUE5_PHOS4|nr:hypothetical protein [Vibrio sinaloensis]KGY09177.1 hypothetical protein NM06_07905 [Vibrio sinaloensis]KHT46108.1 hypothetical protein RJ47_06700 [Vibrio sinaloensis]
MITFTNDSLLTMCRYLQEETFPSETTYLFNDGIQLRTVANFKAIEQYFEGAGMLSSITTGYTLTFESGEEIQFKIKDNQLVLAQTNLPAKAKTDHGVHHSVSQYMF